VDWKKFTYSEADPHSSPRAAFAASERHLDEYANLSGFVASTSEGELGGRELQKLFARANGWPLISGQDHHGRSPHRETDPCARDNVADAAFWNEKRAEHAHNYGRPHNVIARRSQYPR